MTNIQSMGLIFLLLINGPVLAGQWIVGGSLGTASGDADSSQLNDELTSRGINASVSDIDNSRTMMQVFAGYDFESRWGLEVAYVDLGDVSASINGTLTGISDYFSTGQDIYPQTATGWQLSGVYRYPMSGMLQLTARLGVYSWTTDYTLQAATTSQAVSADGTDTSFGLGLETGRWIMQGGFVGHINWNRYSINDESVDVIAIGVSYRF